MNNPTHSLSAFNLILDASPLVQLILLFLVGASILCWAVILSKSIRMKSAMQENEQFLAIFWNSKGLEEIQTKGEGLTHSTIARVFESGYKELRKLPVQDRTDDGQPEILNIERALNKAVANQIDDLEKYVEWLATTASAAPFVGLFGTVWGIMSSFQSIGAMGSASLAVVAPGISEALIATAMGLAAAIPAAIFYNYLLNKIKRISLDTESFVQDFLNMIQRSLLSSRVKKSEKAPDAVR